MSKKHDLRRKELRRIARALIEGYKAVVGVPPSPDSETRYVVDRLRDGSIRPALSNLGDCLQYYSTYVSVPGLYRVYMKAIHDVYEVVVEGREP